MIRNAKIAIVCDWLTTSGGAEKIILSLHKMFPRAPIYTAIYNPEKVKGFDDATIITSGLQKLPFAKNRHQLYLSLMPRAFEKMNLNEYDIVISSSHSCSKGVITRPETLHICYCHSPMRYAWENSINYIKEYDMNPILKKIAPWFMHKIRMWDRLSADRVDYFVANSKHIQQRIYKYYRRPSTVIYPFFDSNKYGEEDVGKKEDYYLAVGRLTPYKRFDLLVETFNQTGLPLKIVGTGVSEAKLKASAKENIEFLGFVSDEELKNLYGKAKALIFPQVEDFGIIPLEAMACGCPVIAYAQGGALETIIDKKTGVLFNKQTPYSLKRAIQKRATIRFNHKNIQKHAQDFTEEKFQKEIFQLIEKKWNDWQKTT
ncbi:glycosyltransferase [Patescibacteria group bacterium]|nr:glycosyltransferase [Patescibacteria group bacterium]MBU1702930.1 glycosyltransferase [Patescibacteria group bacterium]MBU1953480.1 glycosyltransferase [Patescibacteria group bacterium]